MISLDAEALALYERLFREVGPSLWRVVFATAGGRRDIAEDSVAEAFARAMEREDEIRQPIPWLYRTAEQPGRILDFG